MNLYIRYFNDEFVAHNADEAVSFLKGLDISGFNYGEEFVNDLTNYQNSSIVYPKRYRVRTHVYFIVIKTEAETLEEFKNNAGKSLGMDEMGSDKYKNKSNSLLQYEVGWYDAVLNFKRVIAIAGTNKFQYKDTRFRVMCYSESPIECYKRIVNHLRSRQDVDKRSQFPSAKGHNFEYTYLGPELPKDFNR